MHSGIAASPLTFQTVCATWSASVSR